MDYQETPADPREYLPPQESEAVVRARTIRANMAEDMNTTWVTEGMEPTRRGYGVIDALVEDAMFQVEHLLVEIEALHIEKKARDEKDSEDDGSLSEQLGAEVYHG
jgi:hypothetical protein